MSKKKFSLNQNIERGFSETITLAENYEVAYESKPLTITRVIPDPTNPRHLKVLAEDISNLLAFLHLEKLPENQLAEKIAESYIKRISQSDPEKEVKIREIESLKELAIGISKNGLLHPVITYKDNDNYVIVAGERRFLAHLLLNRKYIESRVFTTKPSGLMKKVAQWVENVQREDLGAYARVENVVHITEAYQKEEKTPLTPSGLSEVSGISKASASYYLSIVNGPQDVLLALKENKLQNIKKAALIAGEPDQQKRTELINAAMLGATPDLLKRQKTQNKTLSTGSKSIRKGRAYSKVQFGATKNTDVAKKVVLAIIKQYGLQHFNQKLDKFDWKSYEAVTMIFKELLGELGEK